MINNPQADTDTTDEEDDYAIDQDANSIHLTADQLASFEGLNLDPIGFVSSNVEPNLYSDVTDASGNIIENSDEIVSNPWMEEFSVEPDTSGVPEPRFGEVRYDGAMVEIKFDDSARLGTDPSPYDGGTVVINVVDANGDTWSGFSLPLASRPNVDWNQKAYMNLSLDETSGAGSLSYTGSDTALDGSTIKDATFPLTFSFELQGTGENYGTAVVTGPDFQPRTILDVTTTPGGANDGAGPVQVYSSYIMDDDTPLTVYAIKDANGDMIPVNADTSTNTFTDSTTVTNFNFTGVYQNVRFSWGNSTGNTGVIDKILYRQ